MYNIIKAAINTGDYKLEGMLARIRTFAAKGLLNADEMTELEGLAREHATVKADTDLFEKVLELERRIRALEEGKHETPAEEYPAYVAGKWYHRDDKCSHEGKNYVCVAPDGVVCTWSPAEYPAYWNAI